MKKKQDPLEQYRDPRHFLAKAYIAYRKGEYARALYFADWFVDIHSKDHVEEASLIAKTNRLRFNIYYDLQTKMHLSERVSQYIIIESLLKQKFSYEEETESYELGMAIVGGYIENDNENKPSL